MKMKEISVQLIDYTYVKFKIKRLVVNTCKLEKKVFVQVKSNQDSNDVILITIKT